MATGSLFVLLIQFFFSAILIRSHLFSKHRANVSIETQIQIFCLFVFRSAVALSRLCELLFSTYPLLNSNEAYPFCHPMYTILMYLEFLLLLQYFFQLGKIRTR